LREHYEARAGAKAHFILWHLRHLRLRSGQARSRALTPLGSPRSFPQPVKSSRCFLARRGETRFPRAEFFRNLKKACRRAVVQTMRYSHIFAFGHGGGAVPARRCRRLRSGPVERGQIEPAECAGGRKAAKVSSTRGGHGRSISFRSRMRDGSRGWCSRLRVWYAKFKSISASAEVHRALPGGAADAGSVRMPGGFHSAGAGADKQLDRVAAASGRAFAVVATKIDG